MSPKDIARLEGILEAHTNRLNNRMNMSAPAGPTGWPVCRCDDCNAIRKVLRGTAENSMSELPWEKPDLPRTKIWVELKGGHWLQLEPEQLRELVVEPVASNWLLAICWVFNNLKRQASWGHDREQLLNWMANYAAGALNQAERFTK